MLSPSVIDIPRTNLKVRAGHISHTHPGSQAQTRAVQEIKSHENFNVTGDLVNDIAVLKLSSPLQFSNNVKAIKIPCRTCTVGFVSSRLNYCFLFYSQHAYLLFALLVLMETSSSLLLVGVLLSKISKQIHQFC